MMWCKNHIHESLDCDARPQIVAITALGVDI